MPVAIAMAPLAMVPFSGVSALGEFNLHPLTIGIFASKNSINSSRLHASLKSIEYLDRSYYRYSFHLPHPCFYCICFCLNKVVSCGCHHPMANVIGAIAFAFPLSIALAHVVGEPFWIGTANLWLFIGILTVAFFTLHEMVKRISGLKRLFISKNKMEEEVREAALTSFFKEELDRPRDETGILIFISVFEHQVWVLADKGINAKVPKKQWEGIVNHIGEGIKSRRQGDAIGEAVTWTGETLKERFPNHFVALTIAL